MTTPEPTSRRQGREAIQLYTPDEAAVLLRCKATWLKEQARLRRIPFTLVGGAYRFTIDHLFQIIENNEHLPAPEPATQTQPARSAQQLDTARLLRARRPRSPRDPT